MTLKIAYGYTVLTLQRVSGGTKEIFLNGWKPWLMTISHSFNLDYQAQVTPLLYLADIIHSTCVCDIMRFCDKQRGEDLAGQHGQPSPCW